MKDPTQRLADVFRDALSLDSSVDIPNLKYQDVKSWDSVGHMTLVAAIEDAFGIMLETDDVIDMSSFSKAVEIVGKYNG